MKMRASLLVLALTLLGMSPGNAQGVTRICAPFIGANGANNCVDVIPGQLPPGSGITGNGAGSTGAVVGTLAAAVGKITYICGFSVDAIGGTAAVGPITVAGLIGSSMVFQLTSSATGVSRPVPFTPCVPASAANTAITVTTTADGTASAVNVNSWGYQQ